VADRLLLTKTDLAPATEVLSMYDSLGVPFLTTTKSSSLDALREMLSGRTSALVGHSGVGKSTLVNRLVPDAERATGHVNAVTGRGRHTSSSAVALELSDGGWVIDTPGVRSFGLAHVDVDRVVASFPDLAEVIERCPRGCSHDEEECSLNQWAAQNDAHRVRIEGLRRLLRSRRLGDEGTRQA
jgi:ribosome biogenesis GTPase